MQCLVYFSYYYYVRRRDIVICWILFFFTLFKILSSNITSITHLSKYIFFFSQLNRSIQLCYSSLLHNADAIIINNRLKPMRDAKQRRPISFLNIWYAIITFTPFYLLHLSPWPRFFHKLSALPLWSPWILSFFRNHTLPIAPESVDTVVPSFYLSATVIKNSKPNIYLRSTLFNHDNSTKFHPHTIMRSSRQRRCEIEVLWD